MADDLVAYLADLLRPLFDATVDFILLDDDSGDELDAHRSVPNVMRRRDEDDLL